MSGTQQKVGSSVNPSDNGTSFQGLTDQYRYELLVHCYRILGSIEDAEDGLQETLVRAWRYFDTLKEQSSLRAWLYKIATNVCLDMMDKRKIRQLPTSTHLPATPLDALPALNNDHLWIEPLPEFYLEKYSNSPEQRYE